MKRVFSENPMKPQSQRSVKQKPQRISLQSQRQPRMASSKSFSKRKKTRIPFAFLIVIVAVVVILCVGLSRCGAAPDNAVSQETEAVAEAPIEEAEPDRDTLVSILGQEDADKLLSRLEDSEDVAWITTHLSEYDFHGARVKEKILQLAADEPEAVSYVRDFAERYGDESRVNDESIAISTTSPSSAVPSTSIPHLYQWDRRWGNTEYSSTSFGLTGCGPTSLAMIYQGITGDESLSPYILAQKAKEWGYMYKYEGTDAALFTTGASKLGLNVQTMSPTAQNITQALSAGHPIILNVGPGYFTRNGHYLVLAGLDTDGKVIINDPYSVVRSSQTWEPSFLAQQGLTMFVYG